MCGIHPSLWPHAPITPLRFLRERMVKQTILIVTAVNFESESCSVFHFHQWQRARCDHATQGVVRRNASCWQLRLVNILTVFSADVGPSDLAWPILFAMFFFHFASLPDSPHDDPVCPVVHSIRSTFLWVKTLVFIENGEHLKRKHANYCQASFLDQSFWTAGPVHTCMYLRESFIFCDVTLREQTSSCTGKQLQTKVKSIIPKLPLIAIVDFYPIWVE